MRLLTKVVAWLIGYYYEQCPTCGRYYAILNNGQFVFFCSERKHREAEKGSPDASKET